MNTGIRNLALGALVLGLLTACGGEDAGDANSTAAADRSGAETGGRSGSPYGSGRECPSESVVSEALGLPMVVDPDTPPTAGFFCPYSSPDTDLTVSITFTGTNMTNYPEPYHESLAGVGQAALWSSASDELMVWTGKDSVIISILFLPGRDTKAAAVALANAVLAGG